MKNKVFNFKEDEVKGKILYDLRLMNRMKDSFEYLHGKLSALGFHVEGETPQLAKKHFSEGKSYDWVAITSGNVRMLIRTYQMHYTVYTCLAEEWKGGHLDKYYGAFSFYVNTDKIRQEDKIDGVPDPGDDWDDSWSLRDYYHDWLYDQPFLLFNQHMAAIIEIIGNRDVHTLWNTHSFERPHFVEVKNIHHGEEITSFDELIFCAEEMSTKHMQLFSENEMLEEIKKFKAGDEFNGDMHKGIITEVRTEADCHHSKGIRIDSERWGDKWIDVYSLTRWDLEAVFQE